MTIGSDESELKPLIKSSNSDNNVRRIRRLLTQKITVKEAASKQPITESGQSSRQGAAVKESSDSSIKLDESHPRFGPLCTSADQEQAAEAIKEKAWEHVLKKSSPAGEEKDEEKEKETMEIYLSAVRKVEREAKDMYAGKAPGIGSNFRWMMIKDGCFFLQLALLILGYWKQLGYSSNDPIFGRQQKKNQVKKWIEAMFYAGNQIPLVVLRVLMDQSFFQNVINNAKGHPPPSGLCRMTLYQVLVLPALGKVNIDPEQQHLCDLLHGCHSLVMGPPPAQEERHRADDEIDLEANEDEAEAEEDYEIIRSTTMEEEHEDEDEAHSGSIGYRMRNIFSAMGVLNGIDNRSRIFPSATELKRQGISIRKLETGGARGIHYQSSYYMWAYLYLPALPVDGNAEVVLRNLKCYDNFQQQSGHNGQEVSSYLRFMSDLIQTTRDAKLLQSKGIIQGKPSDVEKLPAMLNRLTSEDIRLTPELRMLRRQIRDYSSPWIHYKGVINLVVFLTLLQTLFALLAYFRPPK